MKVNVFVSCEGLRCVLSKQEGCRYAFLLYLHTSMRKQQKVFVQVHQVCMWSYSLEITIKKPFHFIYCPTLIDKFVLYIFQNFHQVKCGFLSIFILSNPPLHILHYFLLSSQPINRPPCHSSDRAAVHAVLSETLDRKDMGQNLPFWMTVFVSGSWKLPLFGGIVTERHCLCSYFHSFPLNPIKKWHWQSIVSGL